MDLHPQDHGDAAIVRQAQPAAAQEPRGRAGLLRYFPKHLHAAAPKFCPDGECPLMNLQRPHFDPPVPEEVCRGCGSRESALSPGRVCSGCETVCQGCASPRPATCWYYLLSRYGRPVRRRNRDRGPLRLTGVLADLRLPVLFRHRVPRRL